ncbi:hypothetical protein N0V90_005976 [Kalmusia sp. IMI 367209]|nr:hypothetical protein N0V90_005976 [Kalmusia sp. IMI 367209]
MSAAQGQSFSPPPSQPSRWGVYLETSPTISIGQPRLTREYESEPLALHGAQAYAQNEKVSVPTLQCECDAREIALERAKAHTDAEKARNPEWNATVFDDYTKGLFDIYDSESRLRVRFQVRAIHDEPARKSEEVQALDPRLAAGLNCEQQLSLAHCDGSRAVSDGSDKSGELVHQESSSLNSANKKNSSEEFMQIKQDYSEKQTSASLHKYPTPASDDALMLSGQEQAAMEQEASGTMKEPRYSTITSTDRLIDEDSFDEDDERPIADDNTTLNEDVVMDESAARDGSGFTNENDVNDRGEIEAQRGLMTTGQSVLDKNAQSGSIQFGLYMTKYSPAPSPTHRISLHSSLGEAESNMIIAATGEAKRHERSDVRCSIGVRTIDVFNSKNGTWIGYKVYRGRISDGKFQTYEERPHVAAVEEKNPLRLEGGPVSAANQESAIVASSSPNIFPRGKHKAIDGTETEAENQDRQDGIEHGISAGSNGEKRAPTATSSRKRKVSEANHDGEEDGESIDRKQAEATPVTKKLKKSATSRKSKEPVYCRCKQPDGDGRMLVQCEAPRCPNNGWVHLGCMGMTEAPPDNGAEWHCADCEPKSNKKKGRASTPKKAMGSASKKRKNV